MRLRTGLSRAPASAAVYLQIPGGFAKRELWEKKPRYWLRFALLQRLMPVATLQGNTAIAR